MTRLILLLAAMSVAISPGLCSSATQVSSRHAASRACHALKKPVPLPQIAVSSSDVKVTTKPVALSGRLEFDEPGVTEELEAAELQPPCDAASRIPTTETTVSQDSHQQEPSEFNVLEPRNLTLREAGHLAVADWITFLKLLAMKFAPRTLDAPVCSDESSVESAQSQKLAEDIASYIATQAIPQDTTILLAPPKSSIDSSFSLALGDSLRKLGFGVLDSRKRATDAQILRYEVSKLDDGVLVELQFHQKQTNQYYRLDASNDLIVCAPRSVREVR